MATYELETQLQAVENFEIQPPECTVAKNETIFVSQDTTTVPFEVRYPGITEDIPALRKVHVTFNIGQIGSVHELSADEARKAQTLKSNIHRLAFGAHETKDFKFNCSVSFIFDGGVTLNKRSADRFYKVTFV